MATSQFDEMSGEAGARRVKAILVGAWLAVATIAAVALFAEDLSVTGHERGLAAAHAHPHPAAPATEG